MFPHSVTIYNKYLENKVEKWQRTVLLGVYWNAVKGAVMRRTGVASADSLQLIIPFSVRSDGAYKPPKEWAALEDKTGFWTLQSGDTVVKGVVEYEIIKTSAELKEFDHCLSVTSVDTKDFGGSMEHFEVMAK